MINVEGDPVCGAPSSPFGNGAIPVVHCTYPFGHAKIVDSKGHVWDHGLMDEPKSRWKKLK